MFKSLTRSIQNRIVLTTCGLVFLATFLLGTISYFEVSKLTLDQSIETLANETRILWTEVKDIYDDAMSDATIIAKTPPIEGIIRAMKNGGIDPLDGSTLEQWQKRLETIMLSVMNGQPSYLQIRYISLQNDAPELVRVDRMNDENKPRAIRKLQNKVGELYITKLKALSEWTYFISDTNYNREEGVISEPRLLTQRIAVPIFENGRVFGVIMINLNYETLLVDTITKINPKYYSIIFNSAGDYIEFYPETKTSHFHSRDEADYSNVILQSLKEAVTGAEGTFRSEDLIGYALQEQISPTDPSKLLGVTILIPQEEILAKANKILNKDLIVSTLLIILSVVLSGFISHLVINPLQEMTRSITLARTERQDLNLPLDREDEIGELAKAFNGLTVALKDSEIKAQEIIQHALDAIVLTNQDFHILNCNPSCRALFGYKSKEVKGKPLSLLIPKIESPKQFEANDHSIFEFEGIHKNQYSFPIEIVVNRIPLVDNILVGIFIRDITKKREAEKLEKIHTDALEASNKELDQFAYVASHDLKAPLRVIDNTSKWLEEDLAEVMDAESRENIQLMRSRVHRMEKLLDDLLEYSRIGRKKNQYYDEDINGEILMQDLLYLIDIPAGFNVTYSPLFSQVTVKRMPLQQIFVNLINNAIKHSQSDKGNIEVSVIDHEDHYLFSVKDDGPGIDPQYHDTIFEMFQTLKSRDQVEGSGMGLAMVKKHLETFGQKLYLNSEEGKGATFSFTWGKKVSEPINQT